MTPAGARIPRLAALPGPDEVRALEGAGVVPVSHTWIADCETPVGAYLKLRDGGHAFLLESAADGRVSRYSMLGVHPRAVITGRGGRLEMTAADGTRTQLDAADPFGAVQDAVEAVGMVASPHAPGFVGGAVGFFGYDLVRTVERLPGEPPDDVGVPDLVCVVTGPVVVFDHLLRTLTITVPCPFGPGVDPDAAYGDALAAIAGLKERLSGPVPRPGRAPARTVGTVSSNVPRGAYEAAVERCREYIFAGDAFQVVPSQRFTADVDLDPFTIYRGLRAVNPSPYMFFLEFGDICLVGASPETLVKVEGRTVHTRPIAGTRPRGETDAENEALARELLADPKERAEHVMLVDLGRNDLGRVSEVGTVRVEELMSVHHYSHVMHIESSVVGTLADGRRASDALRAIFPAGTLSGAPKVRAMEIIDEMESTKRGPYGGAVGYLAFDGDLDVAITIRTMLCKDGRVHVQAGAGVVADSVASVEYDESRNKAAALFRAVEVAAAQEDW
ncbi:MAG: anthranilate synthase component I [Thermoleophilia bacterium]|nr:anthranilate synthase component I [Thermoleophilia bacterium]